MRKPIQYSILFAIAIVCLSPARSWTKEAKRQRCADLKPGPLRLSEAIGILFSTGVPRKLVEDAVALWATCEGYGTDFPRFVIGREGTQSVEVRFVDVSTGPRCGSFAGRTIILYAFARDREGRLQSCGSRSADLAHELGHVLGLRDSPETECRDHAMAYLDSGNLYQRTVKPEECRVVAERWVTPNEYRQLRTSGPAPAKSNVQVGELPR
jgi:hypothetical protein